MQVFSSRASVLVQLALMQFCACSLVELSARVPSCKLHALLVFMSLALRVRACLLLCMGSLCRMFFLPTAESFGVSAQIGSGVVRGGPEVKVPPGFHQCSTRFCEGCGVARALKEHRMLLGISPELIFCILLCDRANDFRGGTFLQCFWEQE